MALRGPLGAGKTTFARGFVAHFGDAPVSSPTFTIAQTYPTSPPIIHIDFYRLSDPEEAEELGLFDHLGAASITLVEWPERFPDLLPEDHITVHFEIVPDGGRRISVL